MEKNPNKQSITVGQTQELLGGVLKQFMAGQTERKQKFSLAFPALASRIAPKAGYFHTFYEKKMMFVHPL